MPVSQELRDKLAAATKKVTSPGYVSTTNFGPSSTGNTPYYGMPTTNSASTNSNPYAVPQSVKDAVAEATKKVTSPGYQSTTTAYYGMPTNSPSNSYFDSNYKGVNNYAANQQTRYNQALSSGDMGLVQRLKDDAKRVGYTLIDPAQKQGTDIGTKPAVTGQPPLMNTGNMVATPYGTFPSTTDTSNTPVPPPSNPGTFTPPPATDSPQVPVYNPAIPVMDEDAIRKYAEDQTNRKLSDLRLDADQQIQTGQTTADAQVAAAKTAYEQYIRQLQANYDQTTGTAKTDAAKQLAAAQASYDQYVANANANAQSSLGAIQTQYDRLSQDITEGRKYNKRRLYRGGRNVKYQKAG